MKHMNRLIVALLAVTLCCAGAASAQFGPPRNDPNPNPDPRPQPDPNPRNDPNPNPRNDPNPNPDPRPGPNNPVPDPNAPVPEIRLPGNDNPNANPDARPEWLKPGMQVTYAVSDSYNPNPNPALPPHQQPKASAGMGYREYTVIALTDEKVYLQEVMYLAPQGLPLTTDGNIDMRVDPKAQVAGLSFSIVTGLEINQGEAIFMSPARLQAMEQKREANADGTQGSWIDPTSWSYQNDLVKAVKMEYWGESYAKKMVFNRDNGMLLFYHSAIGNPRPGTAQSNIFSREIVDMRQLVHTEQIAVPLIGAPFPEWTLQVKSMQYSGQQAFIMEGAPPVTLPMTLTMTVEHNDGQLMLGKTLVQQQGVADHRAESVMGPGTFLGYWVNPQALAQLRQGEVHKNDATRTVVTYQIQDGPLGRLGVFVHTNEAKNFFAINAYDLQDGKLMYMQFAQPEVNMMREFTLKNVERR